MTKFSTKVARLIETIFALLIAAILIWYLLIVPFFTWVSENIGITIVVGVIGILVVIIIGYALSRR